MGENLALPERNAIRTPMQWSAAKNAGFSGAPARRLLRPIISGGAFGYEKVNVTAQRLDPASMLAWFERMIRTLRECPEVGAGAASLVAVDVPRTVLVHRSDGPTGAMLFLHNLGDSRVRVDLGPQAWQSDLLVEVFTDQTYEPVSQDLAGLDLDGFGYRWIRLRHDLHGT